MAILSHHLNCEGSEITLGNEKIIGKVMKETCELNFECHLIQASSDLILLEFFKIEGYHFEMKKLYDRLAEQIRDLEDEKLDI